MAKRTPMGFIDRRTIAGQSEKRQAQELCARIDPEAFDADPSDFAMARRRLVAWREAMRRIREGN